MALQYDRYHDELLAETARLALLVRSTSPSHPVPTCPDWIFTDLTAHVGQGHRWAATIVERRATEWVRQDEADDRDVPDGTDARAEWLLAGARRLSAAVRDAGPLATVWTWADEQTAGFWLRRLTHETVIHRVDAELAVGHPPLLDAALAADGVSDLLACISTLSGDTVEPMFAALRGEGQTLHFHATDTAGEWFVRRTPTGVEWEHGHRRADVAVRGRAIDLLLVLNRRATGGVSVIGDEQLFAHWLDNSAF